MSESGGERSDVAGKRMRCCFGLQGERDPVGKVRILARRPGPGLQFFTSRLCSPGDAGQCVGQDFTLMLNVEYIAVTGLVAPGRLLPGAQSLPRIGNRVVGIQTLQRSVEQMNAPGVGIAMFDRTKQVTIGRPGVDASQYMLGTLEDFVVQTDTNWRQVHTAVDCAGLPRRRSMDVVDGALADAHTQQVAQMVEPSFPEGIVKLANL